MYKEIEKCLFKFNVFLSMAGGFYQTKRSSSAQKKHTCHTHKIKPWILFEKFGILQKSNALSKNISGNNFFQCSKTLNKIMKISQIDCKKQAKFFRKKLIKLANIAKKIDFEISYRKHFSWSQNFSQYQQYTWAIFPINLSILRSILIDSYKFTL